jgi:hypothetical protein
MVVTLVIVVLVLIDTLYVADQTVVRSNHLITWLRELEGLRRG